MFQSLIGQLQIFSYFAGLTLVLEFQSLIGQLQILLKIACQQMRQSSFNPLQVSYKLILVVFRKRPLQQFQSLIGQLQILPTPTLPVRIIPVSIPYRLATNYMWKQVQPIFHKLFQSLIGQLQIQQQKTIQHLMIMFQSLIGQLQMMLGASCYVAKMSFNPLQVSYKFTIEFWINPTNLSFNPLQVSYKWSGTVSDVQLTDMFQSLIGQLQIVVIQ